MSRNIFRDPLFGDKPRLDTKDRNTKDQEVLDKPDLYGIALGIVLAKN